MTRVLVHMAVPDAKRDLAGTMTGLSGVLDATQIANLEAYMLAKWGT